MIVCHGNNKLTTMTQGENVFDIKAIEAQIKINKEREYNFAIGFTNWCIKNYHVEGLFTGILDEKELLEIYKKEKGL
jgi:hypothetical protein